MSAPKIKKKKIKEKAFSPRLHIKFKLVRERIKTMDDIIDLLMMSPLNEYTMQPESEKLMEAARDHFNKMIGSRLYEEVKKDDA